MLKKLIKKTPVQPNTEIKKINISQESLALAAYYRWLDRGCPHGDDLNDWLESEKKINQKK